MRTKGKAWCVLLGNSFACVFASVVVSNYCMKDTSESASVGGWCTWQDQFQFRALQIPFSRVPTNQGLTQVGWSM